MKSEEKYQLEQLLMKYQNELIEKSQDNQYKEYYRIECIENYKKILDTLIVVQNF